MNKRETIDFLTKNGIDFEITEHKAVFNMSELSEIDIPHPEAEAKNLFVRDDKKKNYYLITVKGDKRVDLKEFRRLNGTRPLSFASAAELADILRLEPGSVTPLGILNDTSHRVHLFLDEEFSAPGAIIGIHPNDNTATVRMRASDLLEIIRAHGNTVDIVAL